MTVFELHGSEDQKRQFALALIRTNGNAMRAGSEVFPDHDGKAIGAAVLWVKDPFVIEIMAIAATQLNADNEGLPTKEELGRKLIAIADETFPNGTPRYDAKDRLKALEQYASIMGMIPKQTDINVNNNITNTVAKVLVVREPVNYNHDDFEAVAMKQQKRLINDSATDI